MLVSPDIGIGAGATGSLALLQGEKVFFCSQSSQYFHRYVHTTDGIMLVFFVQKITLSS